MTTTEQRAVDERVADLRREGMTPADIAGQLAVPVRQVYIALKRVGMQVGVSHRRKVSDPVHELAVDINAMLIQRMALHPELCRGDEWPNLVPALEALITEHAERAGG